MILYLFFPSPNRTLHNIEKLSPMNVNYNFWLFKVFLLLNVVVTKGHFQQVFFFFKSLNLDSLTVSTTHLLMHSTLVGEC